jgi:hypothetical protein
VLEDLILMSAAFSNIFDSGILITQFHMGIVTNQGRAFILVKGVHLCPVAAVTVDEGIGYLHTRHGELHGLRRSTVNRTMGKAALVPASQGRIFQGLIRRKFGIGDYHDAPGIDPILTVVEGAVFDDLPQACGHAFNGAAAEVRE